MWSRLQPASCVVDFSPPLTSQNLINPVKKAPHTMNTFIKTDEPTRRDFVLNIAKSCLGVSVLPMLSGQAGAAPFEGSSKAKHRGLFGVCCVL